MMKTFEMSDLGLMHFFLGIEINQEKDGIFICQKKYSEALLKKFTYYSAGHRRKIQERKWFREDSDWAGSGDDMKNTSGYTFSLGSGMFSWASKKQAIVAQSSTEAEDIAAAATSNQATWLRRILEDMRQKQEEPTTIYCDNKLEEKISDIESENQILRQQTLSAASKGASENPSALATKILENGHHADEDILHTPAKVSEIPESKPRRPPTDRQHEDVDALMECVMKDVGFSQGKPVAAFTIYKCLLHWKSFEAERTSVFDRLIQMIGSAIENQDNNDHMAYWLSNTSTLLFLLQKSMKPAGAAGATPGFRSSPSSVSLAAAAAALDTVRQVEAKYPALLFKQQLTAYVEKIYGIIRDNLKKELGSLLALCIQAPRTSKGSVLRSGRSFGKDSPSNHWQGIIDCLNSLLSTLKENFVPPVLVQKIFTQIFSYINVQLFNSLLLRRECCTFSNGEYVKAGLAELELWCCQAKEEYAGSAWDELKHIRQAVGFLVIHQKYRISYDEITNDLCPILSVQQLYRICTLYWDDNYNTRSVSAEVISSMRVLMTEDSNNPVSNSFLLDDSSSIPFSVDELSTALQVKDFLDVKPAEDLLGNPAFQFLHN
ncbi:UNVERIFIED_CONTAM: Myosin-6 [Sesamum calycinum]|uniref:Myosin-6 n=1 Tax=Sesamum calycinum TaxID=2727403 RepID=A0AAW2RU46_9LAMI